MLIYIMLFVQFCFNIIIGFYFFNMLKNQSTQKNVIDKDNKKELVKLNDLKRISLTVPLSEKTRPEKLEEIVGQDDGLKALKVALCSPNPQHILIYGPPGVGKTAASRVILEEAKKSALSPFGIDSKFIEIDATTIRFDERSIADPLIGSVHDPIYQGAGAYGNAGIPQPKAGAVTKAHGGILFIDEIGELHPVQMNKLLKVLEDRKVFFESAYYSSENQSIPKYIHDIFKNGMPADFRLIGATTRSPDEIPLAIRSRCVELFFKPLKSGEIATVASNAAQKGGFIMPDSLSNLISQYSSNGRDAVNVVQTSGSLALINGSNIISRKDIEWVLESGNFSPRFEKKLKVGSSIGKVSGLAVYGFSTGCVLDIEVSAILCEKGKGSLSITGIIEQEEFNNKRQKFTKTSSAKESIRNILTLMKQELGIMIDNYDIHINFPCSVPVDGPSAGVAVFVALYSAINNIPVDNQLTMTGEISIKGLVYPVGEISAKIDAAITAGSKTAIIPKLNWQDRFYDLPIKVIVAEDISDVFRAVFSHYINIKSISSNAILNKIETISAKGLDIQGKK